MNREPHEKRTRINGGANTVRARSARAESEFGALFMRSPPFTRSRPYMRSPPYSSLDLNELGLIYPRRHHRLPRPQKHIHLAPHAELPRHVHAGLDREADAGYQQPLFARLQVVEVRARAVQVTRVDRVTGAVREVRAVAPLDDHAARGIVYVGAAECGAPRGRVTNEGDRAIARVAHRRPDAARFGARLAHRRDPRLVGIDPAVFARPEIDEQNLTNADGPWMIR